MSILEGEGNVDSLRCYALIERGKNKYEVKKESLCNIFLQDLIHILYMKVQY